MPRTALWCSLALLIGCAYQAPPTAPAIVTPPVIVDPPPLVLPNEPRPLAVALNIGGRIRGDVSYLSVSPLTDAIAEPAIYRWTFGDGQTAETTERKTQHRYTRSGIIEPTVEVAAADGRTATARAKVAILDGPPPPPRDPPDDPPPPPPPPTPGSGLTLALTCTPKPAKTASSCNVNASYNGQVLPSNMVEDVHWIWGDEMEFHTAGPSASYAYPFAGTYRVFATADVHKPTTPPSRGEVRANVEIVVP